MPPILAHAVEEGRHALRPQEARHEVGGPDFETYAPELLICGEEAEDYFQSLDHHCEAQFADRDEASAPSSPIFM